MIVLSCLAVASFAFYVTAQEQTATDKNVFLDSDQDGLSDEEEKAYGTDSQKADTDGDGYSDGAEVKGGYNPLKPAPGDKIIPDPVTLSAETTDEKNLTKEMAQKISAVVETANENNEEITIDQVKDIVSESLDKTITEEELPQIKDEDIKIKEQNYSGLTPEKAAEKKKEDFSDYIVGISYVLSSNSPKPITSTNDIDSLSTTITSELANALTSQNTASLQGLSNSGAKVLEQMKSIEVPAELVDTHKKGMQLAQYAMQLQNKITPNGSDPIADIASYSKIQGLTEVMVSYSTEVQAKFSQYGLQYDSGVQTKLQDYGINISSDLSDKLTQ